MSDEPFMRHGWRRRILRAGRAATSIADQLDALADLLEAAGAKVADTDQWNSIVGALHDCADRLRAIARG